MLDVLELLDMVFGDGRYVKNRKRSKYDKRTKYYPFTVVCAHHVTDKKLIQIIKCYHPLKKLIIKY